MFGNVRKKTHPQGITLLLVVLILSIVSSVALGVTFLIIRQLQQGGDVKSELTAQNEADSGVENVLYQAKLARGSGTNPDTFATDLSSTKFPCSEGSVQTPTFCVSSVPSTIGETSLTTSLSKDQSTTIDFYDPVNISGVNVQAIELSGITDPATWLEVSWVGWTTTGGQIQYQSSATKTFFSGTEISGATPRKIYLILGQHDTTDGGNDTYFLNDPLGYGNCSEASNVADTPNDCLIFPTNTPMNYIVRIKALYGSVPAVTIRGLNNCLPTSCLNPTAQSLPSRATLKVIGKSLAIQQALQVSIPWRTSLAGLYDYVLFSANELNRREAVAPAFFTSGPIEAEQGTTIAASNGSVCSVVGSVCNPWLASQYSVSATCSYSDAISASGNATCNFTNSNGAMVYPLTNVGLSSGTSAYYYFNYRIRVKASASNEKMSISLGNASGTIESFIDTFDETVTTPPKDLQGNIAVDGWETCTSYGFNPASDKTIVVQPNDANYTLTPQLDWFSITSYPIVKAGSCNFSSN